MTRSGNASYNFQRKMHAFRSCCMLWRRSRGKDAFVRRIARVLESIVRKAWKIKLKGTRSNPPSVVFSFSFCETLNPCQTVLPSKFTHAAVHRTSSLLREFEREWLRESLRVIESESLRERVWEFEGESLRVREREWLREREREFESDWEWEFEGESLRVWGREFESLREREFERESESESLRERVWEFERESLRESESERESSPPPPVARHCRSRWNLKTEKTDDF